jgi:hypothetical protein
MVLNRNFAVPVVAFVASTALIAAVFTRGGPKTDIQAYALAFIGLLLGTFASVQFYPIRKDIAGRILCTLTILVTAFWAIEFFGGIAFYTLDKLARHYQR